MRSATLLHRYATRAVLPMVMPYIYSKLDGWYCLIQFPVVAYLLKVAPEDAAPRVEQVLRGLGRGYCPTRGFLTDIGFLQPSPVLERIATQRSKRILLLRATGLNTFGCMVRPRPNRLSGMSCYADDRN